MLLIYSDKLYNMFSNELLFTMDKSSFEHMLYNLCEVKMQVCFIRR